MKMLVTGGAGFIGSHVAEDLLQAGHEVVVFDDLSGGFESNVPKGALFVKGDICDTDLINRLFSEHQFDYVYHLAAYAAEGLSHFIRKFNYNNNLIGSINLINASVQHKIKCFVFTSSIAIYGLQTPPFNEEQPNPADPYGIAKFAVELDLRAAHDMWQMDYIIFRPHNVYGERQNIADKYRNVIGIFINQAMQNKPLTIFGDGSQTRAFTYIKDISSVIANAVFTQEAYNQVFNIGADKDYTVQELAEKIIRTMKTSSAIRYLESRLEAPHAHSTHEKINTVFPNTTKPMPLDEGLKRMIAWAQQTGPKPSQKFSPIEITEKLPDGWK